MENRYSVPVEKQVEALRASYLGKRIVIHDMAGEPNYSGRSGVVRFVDDVGQLHGDWGGLAVNPRCDSFSVIA